MTIGDKALGLVLLLSVLGLGGTETRAQDRAFQFALVGDLPYSKVEEQEFRHLIAMMNGIDLAFVVHIGDMQNDPRPHNRNPTRSAVPCTDEMNEWLLSTFQTIRHPFVMTPGDNDWVDCHYLQSRKVDPLERLTALRAKFYPDGRSLGQRTMAVESQAKDPQFEKFRENLRWSISGVTFATLHITGSNDNVGRTPEMDAEQRERKAANIAWMKQAFAKAKADNSRGLVLMTQANPAFENRWEKNRKQQWLSRVFGVNPPDPPVPTGFDDYLAALAEEMESYEKPVAFLHGDTHLFRIDQPLYSSKTNRPFENFTRVETFGSPNNHWVKVTVDPADRQLFRFEAQIVPENVGNHRTK
jgi:hypothetical protein